MSNKPAFPCSCGDPLCNYDAHFGNTSHLPGGVAPPASMPSEGPYTRHPTGDNGLHAIKSPDGRTVCMEYEPFTVQAELNLVHSRALASQEGANMTEEQAEKLAKAIDGFIVAVMEREERRRVEQYMSCSNEREFSREKQDFVLALTALSRDGATPAPSPLPDSR